MELFDTLDFSYEEAVILYSMLEKWSLTPLPIMKIGL